MTYSIHPAQRPLHAKLVLPGSKSITRRAILLAALADGVSELSSLYIHKNTKTFITALNQLGIVIQLDEKAQSCIIAGGNGSFPKKQATIDCANSFRIVNYLLAACATSQGVYHFDANTSLYKKNISQLLNILKNQGAQFLPNDKETLPLTLIGADSLEGGEVVLENQISGLLISSLLMIAPYARSACTYTIVDSNILPAITKSCNKTCNLMADFGVLVHRLHQSQFMVPVPQRYQARDYTIPTDLTLAGFFFAMAILTNGEITIDKIVSPNLKRAKSKLLAYLQKMGCVIKKNDSSISVGGTDKLEGINAQFNRINNVFLILSILAPFANSPSTLTYKKTINATDAKRLTLLQENFIQLGIKIENGKDYLKIFPSKLKSAEIIVGQDPELAIALTLLGIKQAGLHLKSSSIIKHDYPEFFDLCDALFQTTHLFA